MKIKMLSSSVSSGEKLSWLKEDYFLITSVRMKCYHNGYKMSP